MSNILVTGGMGFIGHNVVSRLEKLGHKVVILDNETSYGIIPSAELSYLMAERKKKVDTYWKYSYDICDIDNVRWLFAANNFDIVVHLASFPRQKVVQDNPLLGNRSMTEGLINLLENSKEFNVKKFVYVSSSMIYGDFPGVIKEDAVCSPVSLYGVLKYTGELITKDYARTYGMAHTIIRPSAVYGPLDVEDRIVAKFMLTAMRGGTLNVNGINELLDFTYVDDTADGIVAAITNDNANNKTYNITKGYGRTILEAAELVVKIVGKGTINIRDKDSNFPSRGTSNIDAAMNDLGYNPKVDMEEGFRLYYDWLKNSPYYNRDE